MKKKPLPMSISAWKLIRTQFPDPVWFVPGIIPQGLTLLVGKAKSGKTSLALDLAVGLAIGNDVLGSIEVQALEVLYVPFEDTQQKLQPRIDKKMKRNPVAQKRLHFVFNPPDIELSGVERLQIMLQAHPNKQLVVIDTLALLMGSTGIGKGYAASYGEMIKLKEIADRQGTAIVLLHHTRKGNGDGILDSVAGSVGFTAAVDNVLILTKGTGQADAFLHITGRDLQDMDLALRFDRDERSFVLLGSSEEYRMSEQRKAVLDILIEAGVPLKLSEIATAMKKNVTALSNLLKALTKEGQVKKVQYGVYQIAKKE